MKNTTTWSCWAVLLLGATAVFGEGPLPEFTTPRVILNPEELNWCPTEEIEHPGLIKMEGLIENPLGKYYLYYGPHAHAGIGLAYADSLEGPWTEYAGNPLIEGCAAPDVRWVVDDQGVGKFYMWAHKNNPASDYWTSDDGLHFEYQGIAVSAKEIGTKNASYTRFYEYPLEKYGSRYIMIHAGLNKAEKLRSIWMAYSNDAENWTQIKEPLVSPVESEGEKRDIHGASFFQWKGRNYIIYSDNAVWRGGRLRYVEVDKDLTPLGTGGKRYTLIDPPAEIQGRLRGTVFMKEGDTIHMISGGGKSPRLAVHASAKNDE